MPRKSETMTITRIAATRPGISREDMPRLNPLATNGFLWVAAHPKSEASVAMSSQRGQARRFAGQVVAFVNDRAPIGIPSTQILFLLHPVRNLCCSDGKGLGPLRGARDRPSPLFSSAPGRAGTCILVAAGVAADRAPGFSIANPA